MQRDILLHPNPLQNKKVTKFKQLLSWFFHAKASYHAISPIMKGPLTTIGDEFE